MKNWYYLIISHILMSFMMNNDEAKNISESFTVKSIVQGFKNGNYTTPID